MEPLKLKPVLRAAIVGGLWGAVFMPLLVVMYVALFLPGAFAAGWGRFLISCPIPVGILVGLTVGIAKAFRAQGFLKASGWLYATVGALMGLLSLNDAMPYMTNHAADMPTWGYLATPVFGWPFLWGVMFLAFGLATLRKQRMALSL